MTGWAHCSADIKNFVEDFVADIRRITVDNFAGAYLHGSLAMGGFNSQSSDVDILVVTERSVTLDEKRKLAELLLQCSSHPYPIEISILAAHQLVKWKHPTSYEFHYSEMWRAKYELDLERGSQEFLNHQSQRDADLAAHLTVTRERGVCLAGQPIGKIIPFIPREHYLDSILRDFCDCLDNITATPIYSVLNLVRVYWYARDGVISSKEEAGEWALFNLPEEFKSTVQKVIDNYSNAASVSEFTATELSALRDYIEQETSKFLS